MQCHKSKEWGVFQENKNSQHVIFDSNVINLVLPWCSHNKESTCIAKDLGSVPGLERSSEEVNDYPLQYSCQENSMNKGA